MRTAVTTIADLHAAVLDLRPDAEAAGVTVDVEHVRDAMTALGLSRYEDLTRDDVGQIADQAVELAA